MQEVFLKIKEKIEMKIKQQQLAKESKYTAVYIVVRGECDRKNVFSDR